jgi:hypothetical protein
MMHISCLKREVSLKEQKYKIGVYLLIIVIDIELLFKLILVSLNFLKIKCSPLIALQL